MQDLHFSTCTTFLSWNMFSVHMEKYHTADHRANTTLDMLLHFFLRGSSFSILHTLQISHCQMPTCQGILKEHLPCSYTDKTCWNCKRTSAMYCKAHYITLFEGCLITITSNLKCAFNMTVLNFILSYKCYFIM
jgi:hypothetical protein